MKAAFLLVRAALVALPIQAQQQTHVGIGVPPVEDEKQPHVIVKTTGDVKISKVGKESIITIDVAKEGHRKTHDS